MSEPCDGAAAGLLDRGRAATPDGIEVEAGIGFSAHVAENRRPLVENRRTFGKCADATGYR